MDARRIKIAQTCLQGAETDTMTFPQIVGTLMREGFESYAIDFRRSSATATCLKAIVSCCQLTAARCRLQARSMVPLSGKPSGRRNSWCPVTPMRVSARRSWRPAVRATSYRFSDVASSISAALPKLMSSTFHSRGENLGFCNGLSPPIIQLPIESGARKTGAVDRTSATAPAGDNHAIE